MKNKYKYMKRGKVYNVTRYIKNSMASVYFDDQALDRDKVMIDIAIKAKKNTQLLCINQFIIIR